MDGIINGIELPLLKKMNMITYSFKISILYLTNVIEIVIINIFTHLIMNVYMILIFKISLITKLLI